MYAIASLAKDNLCGFRSYSIVKLSDLREPSIVSLLLQSPTCVGLLSSLECGIFCSLARCPLSIFQLLKVSIFSSSSEILTRHYLLSSSFRGPQCYSLSTFLFMQSWCATLHPTPPVSNQSSLGSSMDPPKCLIMSPSCRDGQEHVASVSSDLVRSETLCIRCTMSGCYRNS